MRSRRQFNTPLTFSWYISIFTDTSCFSSLYATDYKLINHHVPSHEISPKVPLSKLVYTNQQIQYPYWITKVYIQFVFIQNKVILIYESLAYSWKEMWHWYLKHDYLIQNQCLNFIKINVHLFIGCFIERTKLFVFPMKDTAI